MSGSSLVGTGSGGIHKLNGVQAIGQEVTLTSVDASIVITPDNVTKTVDLSASGPGSRNFSFNIIPTATSVTIPFFQQMITYQDIDIQGSGDLDVNGEVVVLD